MLQTMVLDFLGTPPAGSEWLQYQYAGITYVIMLLSILVFGIFITISVINILKYRR